MSVNYAYPNAIDPGMTLRDWFAGQALVVAAVHISEVAIASRGECSIKPDEAIAAAAYSLADAMLKAREVKP